MFGSRYSGAIVHDREDLRRLGNGNPHPPFWARVDRSDPSDRERLVALYDGLIAELDHYLAGLLTAIEEHAPNSIIIVTSDHGELFGEYGHFEHSRLYREVLHVPLIVRHPRGARGVRFAGPVSLINLAPAVMRMLGLPLAPQFQGAPPLRVLRRVPIFAEFPVAHAYTVLAGGQQLIDRGVDELYFVDDPAAEPPAAGRLRRTLEVIRLANAAHAVRYIRGPGKRGLDPATLERLRGLGYLQ